MKASEILSLLEKRHAPPEWVFLSELRLGTGYGGKNNKWERRIDAWAINCYPSKGMVRISYEIKVSRADFLAELRQPEKRASAMEVSNQFFFVAPEGIIAENDLPGHCGLIVVREGSQLVQRYSATFRDCPSPSWRFVASLARRTL